MLAGHRSPVGTPQTENPVKEEKGSEKQMDESPGVVHTIVSAAVGLLVAVIALYLAVALLRCVWPWLLGLGVLFAIVAGVVVWVQRERSPW